MIDITMPRMNGLDATEIVSKQYKGTRSLVLSMHENEDYILKAVEAGALGYLLKDSSKEEILDAIKTVAAGKKYFNGPVSNIIINGYLNSVRNSIASEDKTIYKVSKKEKEILGHIIDGKNSREIAEILGLSVRTVDNHRANMMKRLEVKNAVELVKLALDKKLV
jgi:DNA-binding NarL/FixJ family response regulator